METNRHIASLKELNRILIRVDELLNAVDAKYDFDNSQPKFINKLLEFQQRFIPEMSEALQGERCLKGERYEDEHSPERPRYYRKDYWINYTYLDAMDAEMDFAVTSYQLFRLAIIWKIYPFSSSRWSARNPICQAIFRQINCHRRLRKSRGMFYLLD